VALLLPLTTTIHLSLINVTVSSLAGDRLTKKKSLHWNDLSLNPDFVVNPEERFQVIDGFGASFVEAGLLCLNSLPKQYQEDLLEIIFSPTIGSGFSIMKTTMAANDFMSAGPWYTYDETPNDTFLKDFSISRDLKINGSVTFIHRAQKYGNFKLQSYLDFPPTWMMKGLDIDKRYYSSMALYYLKYVQEYAKQGIHIDYLSLLNEPEDSYL